MVVSLLDFRKAPNDLLLEVRNWRNHQDISTYFIIDEISLETHKNWLETKIKYGTDQAFLIMNNDSPEGCVYFRNIDSKHLIAEFGIFLKPTVTRGMGIGSQAIEQILDYGFSKLGLDKIYLQVFDFNEKAELLYKKFGFVSEGKLRKHYIKSGKRVDMNFMGLLKSEWEKK